MYTVIYTPCPEYHNAFGGASAGFRHEYAMFDVPQSEESRNEVVVVVSQQLVDQISQADLELLVLHEEGHIASGHLTMATADNTLVIDGCNVTLQSSLEIEADAYAAARSSPLRMLSMLVRLSDQMLNNSLATMPVEQRDKMRGYITHFMDMQMNPRLAALRAMV